MKIDRLLSIILLLLDKKQISAQALAELFEVSSRTIYRDIEAINQAGIPIRSTSGAGGGFEILENYKLERKIFSATDLSTILQSLSSLTAVIQSPELANATAKVKSFVPNDQTEAIELNLNQLHIDLSPWMGNQKTQASLTIIKKALQTSRLLIFEYLDRHGNATFRTIEPYQLVLKGNHWYCQGFCLTRNDYRLFKVTRMAELQLTEENFLPRKFKQPLLNFSDQLAAMQITIKLRIHESIREDVSNYCDTDCFIPSGEEYYLVDFSFVENDYYYNVLFSFGTKCKCLGPKHVQAEIKRRINEFADLYPNSY